MQNINQTIKAVVLGHAVADALGVPVEFLSREALCQEPVCSMLGYGTYPVPAGSWSDDTSMSLAALDCIASGSIHWDRIMVAFGEWYYKDNYTPTGVMFDVGGTCSRAIDNYFVRHMPVESCGLYESFANGNGSLMRIHPFSLMSWFCPSLHAQFETVIDRASALTHGHERSKLACKIYTQILFALLEQPKRAAVVEALRASAHKYCGNPEYGAYERLFSSDFADLPVEAIKSSGYVVDSLEAAVWCLLTTDSYRACVLKAVNLGEDTDTVAAIAGGLAGALYGYDAIPREWLDTLIKREYIEEMCDRAAAVWATTGAEQIFLP